MQTTPPLPTTLRRRKHFQIGENWYIISLIEGLSMIEIVDVSPESVIFRYSTSTTNDGLPIQSPMFVSMSEYAWLRKVITKAKSKKINDLYTAIINDVYAHNLESVIFINWIVQVQRAVIGKIKPEAMEAFVEKLFKKIS